MAGTVDGHADLQRSRVVDAFEDLHGVLPGLVARAPGRVNLIGEHTDYNDGFVLPMAIDREVWIALRPRTDQRVRVRSLDFGQDADFDLNNLTHGSDGWVDYLRGVAAALQTEWGPRIRGWEGVIGGNVPLGAGLSSSAALELATARAFAAVSGIAWVPADMARIGQRAENEWVGVRCGIMDQMISAAGRRDHALLIDCRSLDTRTVPIPLNLAIVVLDTGTRRGLRDSAYNDRRAQCNAAAAHFGVRALRDIDLSTFEELAQDLEPTTRKRARHIVTENARTLAAAVALERDDACTVGLLMNASHASLRDDFEVSSGELNAIVAAAVEQQGCYGARMTGAGFGGCAVALVERASVPAFTVDVSLRYRAETGLEPSVYVCSAADGASIDVGIG